MTTPLLPIAFDVDPVTISCYRLESGAYRVDVVWLGGGPVNELCDSYPTEPEARNHARLTAKLISAGWSVQRLIDLRDLFNPQISPSSGVRQASPVGGADFLPCEEDQP